MLSNQQTGIRTLEELNIAEPTEERIGRPCVVVNKEEARMLFEMGAKKISLLEYSGKRRVDEKSQVFIIEGKFFIWIANDTTEEFPVGQFELAHSFA